MTRARFDAILFDAGGIFITPDPVAIAPVLGPLGGTTDTNTVVRAHYFALNELERPALTESGSIETMDWSVYRRAMAASCGVAEHRLDDAVSGLDAIWSPIMWRHRLEESVSALWRLSRANVPIGVVSNASGQVEHMLKFQGICQVGPGAGVSVACVIDSAVVGIAKPNPKIFEPALAALGRNAGPRIAYVGDSVINDVGGAINAGLTPLLYDPFGDRADLANIECLTSLHDLHPMVA
jgi:putative hydrolase of the HAD superfamily